MNYIIEYSSSCLIYIIMLFIFVVVAYLAQRYNSKKFLSVLIIVMSLFMGLRADNVGTDTKNYIEIFENIVNYGVNSVYTDKGFNYLSLLLLNLFKDVHLLICFYSVITVVFFILGLWDLRDYLSLPICIITLFIPFYIQGFNILRQVLALSIVFWGTKFLRKNKYIPFFTTLIISTALHYSCFIFLLYFVFYYLKNIKQFKMRNFLILILILIFTSIFLATGMLQNKMESYITNDNIRVVKKSFFSLSLVIVLLIMSIFVEFRRNNYFLKKHKLYKNDYYISYITYIVGVLIGYALSNYSYGVRAVLGLQMFECFIWSYKYDNRIIIYFKRVFIITFTLYRFYSTLKINGYGILPYDLCF